MVKIGELNRIDVAAQWIAEQLGDDGYTTDYLLDLGIRRELTLQAAIPTDSLTQPKDGKGFGLNMVFFDGVVDLDSLDCRALQAQGSIKVSEVESIGVLRQLDRTVTITYDDVRIKKDVLERYVAKHTRSELSRQAQVDIAAPYRANEKAAPPGALTRLPEVTVDTDDGNIARLFDPVKTAQLEAMFPDGGRWAAHAERAARNGLKNAAKVGNGLFNPYRAAAWWLTTGPGGWRRGSGALESWRIICPPARLTQSTF